MRIKEKKLNSKLSVLLLVLLVANVVLAGMLIKNISKIRQWEAQFAEQTVSENNAEKIEIMLPDTVYAVSGITMEIYNAQVTSLSDGITRYNVCWKCDVGENLERKFSVTANEENIGTYDLTMEIYNHNLELLAQKACTLKIVEAAEQNKEAAKAVTNVSEVPAECLGQVKISVDTEYFGALEELKPEGVKQMQDMVYSVLCGN